MLLLMGEGSALERSPNTIPENELFGKGIGMGMACGSGRGGGEGYRDGKGGGGGRGRRASVVVEDDCVVGAWGMGSPDCSSGEKGLLFLEFCLPEPFFFNMTGTRVEFLGSVMFFFPLGSFGLVFVL